MKKINFLGCILLLFTCDAFAYRQDVHMALTDEAVSRSVLANTNIMIDWGWDYTTAARYPYQVTKNDLHHSAQPTLNFAELINYGVDAEDTDEGNDQLKRQNWNRAVNHFYNPQANGKIDVWGFFPNYTSPEWALGANVGVTIPYQHFSYSDAQRYFYAAFAAPTKAQRDLAMGMTFQTLGHVIHHIQDMAQPEHTRLDSHCDDEMCRKLYDITGNDDSSLYEEYTQDLLHCGGFDSNLVAANTPRIECRNFSSWGEVFAAKKVSLSGYVPPMLNAPIEYWHTADNKGLADFSSRNFITTDTPFQINSTKGLSFTQRLSPASADLPYPSGAAQDVYLSTVTLDQLMSSSASGNLSAYKNYKMNFVGIHGIDNLTGMPVELSRMATYSIFTERLDKLNNIYRTPSTTFSVNYFNLEQWAETLLPRAVSYSAGLINYFFRLRLKIIADRVWGAPDVISVRNESNSTFDGHFDFYYDGEDGLRHLHSSSERVVLAPGKSLSRYKLEVPRSLHPTTHFFVIAVENDGQSAVAVRSFEHNSLVEDTPSSSGSTSSTAPEQLGCGLRYHSSGYCNARPDNCAGHPFTFESNYAGYIKVNMGSKSGNVLVLYNFLNNPTKAGEFSITDIVGGYIVPPPERAQYDSGWAKNFYYDAAANPSHTIYINVAKSSPDTEVEIGLFCPDQNPADTLY